MKERAADKTAPVACAAERLSLRLAKPKKGSSAPDDHRRVVEFMPRIAAGPPECAVSEKPSLPVAEMQSARREAGRVSEQADHGMAHPLRVLKAFAQHHVAAALAVDRAGHRKLLQPLPETTGVRQHTGM